MNLVFITKLISVDPQEICLLEEYRHNRSSPSGGSPWSEENGVIVTLKNGRKVYIEGLTTEEVHKKLKEGTAKE